MLWKIYPGGHELNAEALALARSWFDAVLSGSVAPDVGEDDTLRTVPVSAMEAIDIEFRNPLFNAAVREGWRQ